VSLLSIRYCYHACSRDRYRVRKNNLRFSAGGAEWTSVNDGSYQFLMNAKEEAEWFHLGQRIPPLCVLECKRSTAPKGDSARDAQLAGEMIAVACARNKIFGGDEGMPKAFQREVSLLLTLVDVWG
jgi:hypothetical protein